MEPVSATHTAMVAALAMSDAVHTVKKKQNAPQRSHHHPGQTPWPLGSNKGTSRLSSSPAAPSSPPLVPVPQKSFVSSKARRSSRARTVLHPELGGVGGERPVAHDAARPTSDEERDCRGGSDARARGRSRYFLAAEHRSIRRFASRGWRRPAASPVQHTSGFCSVLLSTRLCSAVDRVRTALSRALEGSRGRAQRAQVLSQLEAFARLDTRWPSTSRVRHARWAPERRLGVLSARGSRFSF